MTQSRRRLAPLLAAAATLALAVAAAPFFGPPTITVTEVSGTPPTPGAVLQVVATHHTDEEKPQVSARAEGMRAGKRITQPIVLTESSRKGTFGVTKQWEAGQPWVLVFTIVQGDHGAHGTAEALVKVDARGRVVSAESLKEPAKDGYRAPRKATEAEILAAITSLQ